MCYFYVFCPHHHHHRQQCNEPTNHIQHRPQLQLCLDNEPVDSWDADEVTLITPEDEEMDVDGDEDDIALQVIKKKPPKPEESKSKKEHVNVVFIGHVGKWHHDHQNNERE